MFVVFEGIDGSGKTTISNRVAKALKKRGLSVTHVRAEGKLASPVAESIREFGRDSRNLELAPRAEFLFYVARDVQMLDGPLRAALGSSDVVLADRYRYTAENLGRFGRHLPQSVTRPILDAALGEVTPDLVVLVDVDPALARARRKASKLGARDRRPPSRKGLSGVGLQYRIRSGYLQMAAEAPERWVVAPNEGSLDDAVRAVTDLVVTARADGAAAAVRAFPAPGKRVVPPIAGVEEALARFLAWVDARAVLEPEVAAYFLRGLAGAGVDERRLELAERVPVHVLAGLGGLDDAVSWSIRDRFAHDNPAAVARTLSGLPVVGRAAAAREALSGAAPADVAGTLGRFDDAAAWALRERLSAAAPDAVVGSLAGLSSERAWAARARFIAERGDALGSDYEMAKLAARCISGVDDERAWELRERALGAAPVAVITSLLRLDGPRAFEWRRRYLLRAPKPVMMTLRDVRSEEAWELRRRVADDCKEALDSIQGLDDEPAWELRQQYADVWPSTVVKTLGELAGSERGGALVARQLTAYPGSSSLLKHAAAIALGGYRGDSEGDS